MIIGSFAGYNKAKQEKEVESVMCGFIKGMGAGMVLGMCVGVTLAADKRRSRKMINRAVRNMGDIAEKMADAIGM